MIKKIVVLIFLQALILSGCSIFKEGNKINIDFKRERDFNRNNLKFIGTQNNVKKIEDLAYNPDTHTVGRIYILENNEYKPYLVIEKDYDGKVLVIRENVREENIPFFGKYTDQNKPEEDIAHFYYGNSFVDYYLNHRFLSELTNETKKYIEEANIEVFNPIVKDKEINGIIEQTKSVIKRKVFLLSEGEVFNLGNGEPQEGNLLTFFTSRKMGELGRCSQREGSTEEGISSPWSLRTIDLRDNAPNISVSPNLDEDYLPESFGKVMEDNVIGDAGYNSSIAITGYEYSDNPIVLRPAFTLLKETPVIKTKINGTEEVFALEEREQETRTKFKLQSLKDLKTDSSNIVNKIFIDNTEFLVLDNYEQTENILILRNDPIEIFIDNPLKETSYEKSYIDMFLENKYLQSLEEVTPVDSLITVSVKNKPKQIIRKVFSLSAEEIMGGTEFYLPKLGSAQKYFEDTNNRITPKKEPYMLRDYNYESPTEVTSNGSIMHYRNTLNLHNVYIRPAFCLNENTQIYEKDGKLYLKD